MKRQRFLSSMLVAATALTAAFATSAAWAQGHGFHPLHSVRMPNMPPQRGMVHGPVPVPQTVIVIGGPPMMPPNMMRGWPGMGGPMMIPPPMCPPMMTGPIPQPPGMWCPVPPPQCPVIVVGVPEMPEVSEPNNNAEDQDVAVTVSAPPVRVNNHHKQTQAPPQIINDDSQANADEVVRKLHENSNSLVVDSDRGIDLLLQDAQSALQLQRWAEAEQKALAAAIEVGAGDRQRAEGYVVIAVAQYMMGNFAKAKDYLRKAVKAAPSGVLPNANLLTSDMTSLYFEARREELGR